VRGRCFRKFSGRCFGFPCQGAATGNFPADVSGVPF